MKIRYLDRAVLQPSKKTNHKQLPQLPIINNSPKKTIALPKELETTNSSRNDYFFKKKFFLQKLLIHPNALAPHHPPIIIPLFIVQIVSSNHFIQNPNFTFNLGFMLSWFYALVLYNLFRISLTQTNLNNTN